jgi:hypothetical protein
VQVIQKNKTAHACHSFIMNALIRCRITSVQTAGFHLPDADVECAEGNELKRGGTNGTMCALVLKARHVFV